MRSSLAVLPALFTLCAVVSCAATSCGGPSVRDETNEQPAVEPEATEGPTPATPTTGAEARLEIHEWGLIDVDLTSQQAELAAGPGVPSRPVIARKPVLYLHLLGEPGRFAIGARTPAGAILEHWPAGTLGPDTVSWEVDVRHGACPVAPARDLQQREAVPCTTPDGFCEVPELPRYVTDDHDCIAVGGRDASLLFYRASTRVDALPIRVTRASDLSVTVTATRELSGAPGSILRISTALSGPWPQGHVVIARAPMPGVGQSMSIPVGTEAIDPALARGTMERELAELGLTRSESAAFLTAWADALFGPATRVTRRGLPAASVPQDVLLYWMPPSAIDAVSTITVEPGPAVVRRAFLVRVNLGGVSTASL